MNYNHLHTRIAQISLLVTFGLATGCRLFPQRGLYISNHSPQTGMVTVFSAPAELQMNSLIYRPDKMDPSFSVYTNLIYRLAEAQHELAKGKNCTNPADQKEIIKETENSLNAITPYVLKPMVLMGPPQQAVVTLSGLELSATGSGSVSGTPGKGDGKLAISQAALELGANRNSDKPQMLYRLNEIAVNFPDQILTNYANLFTAIVNAPVSTTTNVINFLAVTNPITSITTITPSGLALKLRIERWDHLVSCL